MLIQFEQKPWKLVVVVGEQEGKREGAKGTLNLGGKERTEKSAVTANGQLLLQLEWANAQQKILRSFFSSGSGVLAPASFPESRQE
jgi:hypothetical protein